MKDQQKKHPMQTKKTFATAKTEIDYLKREIQHHNTLYYVLDKPSLSDREYDSLYGRLNSLEKGTEEWK